MNEFRLRESGLVITEAAFRASHEAVFPAVIDTATLDAFGVDVVLAAPAPTLTQYQSALRDGVVQDSLGNWVYGWAIVDWTQEQIDASLVVPVPPVVTMRQARLQLLASSYLTTVNEAISGMTGTQGDAARIEWEYSQTVERDKSLTQAMKDILGLTVEQMDTLFIEAAKL